MESDATEHKSLVALAKEITADANKVVAVVERIRDGVEEGGTEKGLSILELKNNLMLEYLTNLSYVALRKTEGMKIEGEQAIERLVTSRTVLEKIRPIEQKLKYQIDKAIKVADSGQVSAKDPMNFKANPAALMSKLGDGEDDEEEDDGDDHGDVDGMMGGAKRVRKDGKYVAPKNVPAYYEEGGDSKEAEEAKKRKKQQLSKAMIEDLKRQHLDTPEEVFEREDVMRKKQINTARERTRFEEENFYRLPLTKKERLASRKKLSTVNSIGDEVTSFGVNYFSSAPEGGGGGSGKKRKRGSAAGGKKKKKW